MFDDVTDNLTPPVAGEVAGVGWGGVAVGVGKEKG